VVHTSRGCPTTPSSGRAKSGAPLKARGLHRETNMGDPLETLKAELERFPKYVALSVISLPQTTPHDAGPKYEIRDVALSVISLRPPHAMRGRDSYGTGARVQRAVPPPRGSPRPLSLALTPRLCHTAPADRRCRRSYR
jgi:hypothetical protein